MARDYCNIVLPLSGQCESPPGWEGLADPPRSRCYRCGLPVCRACSKITAYRKRRVRMCSHCLEELAP
jgi:hypothetical protein